MGLIAELPGMKNLAAGVHRDKLGDVERVQELLGSFLLAVSIGALCIYLVLVLLFGELLQPLTVMSALPLSMGGAFGALLITGSSLSMPSLLGLLMLMGISGKNSILLVDYAIHARRERGLRRREALLEACRQRVKPIVMTSVAMSAGMLPVALGIGADASFRAPMAIAVIGGLVTSTALSLVLVPVLFTLTDDLGEKVARLWRRRTPAASAPAPRPIIARPVWVPGALSALDDLP
jgi:multidrug efflux pump subunit AcrB